MLPSASSCSRSCPIFAMHFSSSLQQQTSSGSWSAGAAHKSLKTHSSCEIYSQLMNPADAHRARTTARTEVATRCGTTMALRCATRPSFSLTSANCIVSHASYQVEVHQESNSSHQAPCTTAMRRVRHQALLVVDQHHQKSGDQMSFNHSIPNLSTEVRTEVAVQDDHAEVRDQTLLLVHERQPCVM